MQLDLATPHSNPAKRLRRASSSAQPQHTVPRSAHRQQNNLLITLTSSHSRLIFIARSLPYISIAQTSFTFTQNGHRRPSKCVQRPSLIPDRTNVTSEWPHLCLRRRNRRNRSQHSQGICKTHCISPSARTDSLHYRKVTGKIPAAPRSSHCAFLSRLL